MINISICMGSRYMENELIDLVKNLISTLVPRSKELSLVNLGITTLYLLYLFGYVEVFFY